jgi:hypothetical protein
LHFQDDLTDFGEKVLPLVREYEDAAIASGEALSWPTFDNYPPKQISAQDEAVDSEERAAKRIKT